MFPNPNLIGDWRIFPSLEHILLDHLDVNGGDWSSLVAFLACRLSSGNRLGTLVITDSAHMCPEVVKSIRRGWSGSWLLFARACRAPLVLVQSRSHDNTSMVLSPEETWHVEYLFLDTFCFDFSSITDMRLYLCRSMPLEPPCRNDFVVASSYLIKVSADVKSTFFAIGLSGEGRRSLADPTQTCCGSSK